MAENDKAVELDNPSNLLDVPADENDDGVARTQTDINALINNSPMKVQEESDVLRTNTDITAIVSKNENANQNDFGNTYAFTNSMNSMTAQTTLNVSKGRKKISKIEKAHSQNTIKALGSSFNAAKSQKKSQASKNFIKQYGRHGK